MSSNILNCCIYRAAADTFVNDFTWTVVYIHVAADWADIFDTPTKQEKTYLKQRCTPFSGNMLFNPETVAKRCAPV